MALIQINNELININLKPESSLQSILPQIRGRKPYSDYNVVSISLNGLKVETDFDRSSLSRPLVKEDLIKITLDGNPNLDIIKNIEELSQSIINKISKLNFESKNVYQESLSGIIAGVGIFIKSSSYIVNKLHSRCKMTEDLPVKNLQIHLLSVLKGIETAHNSGDLLMLEDLLEFELKDNLTKWKILVTPKLKTLAKNPF